MKFQAGHGQRWAQIFHRTSKNSANSGDFSMWPHHPATHRAMAKPNQLSRRQKDFLSKPKRLDRILILHFLKTLLPTQTTLLRPEVVQVSQNLKNRQQCQYILQQISKWLGHTCHGWLCQDTTTPHCLEIRQGAEASWWEVLWGSVALWKCH